ARTLRRLATLSRFTERSCAAAQRAGAQGIDERAILFESDQLLGLFKSDQVFGLEFRAFETQLHKQWISVECGVRSDEPFRQIENLRGAQPRRGRLACVALLAVCGSARS